MAVYSTNNLLGGGTQVAIASSVNYATQILLTAATATLTRAMVQELDVGAPGTPADTYLEYDVSRTNGTTAGTTGTLVTPSAMDTTYRAAGTVANINYSAEPTVYSSSLFYIALNQRASYRWVAAPGSEIVIPATNLFGVGLRARGSATTKLSATLIHVE